MMRLFRVLFSGLLIVSCVSGQGPGAGDSETKGTTEATPRNMNMPAWFYHLPEPRDGKVFFSGFSGDRVDEKSALDNAIQDAHIQAARYHETKIDYVCHSEEIVNVINSDTSIKKTMKTRLRIYASGVIKNMLITDKLVLKKAPGKYHGYVLMAIDETTIAPSVEHFEKELKKPLTIVIVSSQNAEASVVGNLHSLMTNVINFDRKLYALEEKDTTPIFKDMMVDIQAISTERQAINVGMLMVCDTVVFVKVLKTKGYLLTIKQINVSTWETIQESFFRAASEEELYTAADQAAVELKP